MVKWVSFKFEQCLGAFTMLLFDLCSEMWLFGIDVTMFLGVRNFAKTSPMKVIVFWKCSQFRLAFKKEEKNREEVACLWDNSIWIRCIKLSLSRENTCHRHSVCYETVLRFCISLTETFCQTIAFPVISKYCKGAVLQIWTMLGGI